MLASRNGHNKVVEMLIQHNGNVDIQDKEGITALIWAS